MTKVRWRFNEREQSLTRTRRKVTVPDGVGARSLDFRATGQGETSQWLDVSEEAVEFLRDQYGEDRIEVKS